MTTWADRLAELRTRRHAAIESGGPEGLARHRASGRLPVRERIDLLLDPDSWFEICGLAQPEYRRDRPVPGDAVVTGFGRLDGRRVGVIGIDASILAGTTAPVNMRKHGRLIEHSQRHGFPLVLLCDADGGRMPDCSGWRFSTLPLDFGSFLTPPAGVPFVPRVAAVLGPCYGDSAMEASSADYVVMVRSGAIGLSGPSVVEGSIGEVITDAELGGPAVAAAAGSAHLVVETEADAMDAIGAYLSYMPQNAAAPPRVAPAADPARPPSDLAEIVPADGRVGYDMRDVFACLADAASLMPYADDWGASLLCSFARIEGRAVGLVGNQPIVRAGALDHQALDKERTFVRLCDRFGLPVVFLQDVPGLMVGTQAERNRILHHFDAVVSTIAETTVPTVSVVLRKAFGGGHFAMGGRPTRVDFLYAWPIAEFGFMAPETGIRATERRRLHEVLDRDGPEAEAALIELLRAEWAVDSEPWEAAAHLALDDVIAPTETRRVIADSLEIARGGLE